jgi:hypothetical protein
VERNALQETTKEAQHQNNGANHQAAEKHFQDGIGDFVAESAHNTSIP